MPDKRPLVLLSWVAVNNDPYERDRNTGDFRRVGGDLVPGPTLTLLHDPDSPYKGVVGDIVFFHRSADNDSRESRALAETVRAIREQCPGVRVSNHAWTGNDPTDHQEIYSFLRKALPGLREQFSGRKLLIHLSPGTPAMHTVWVLMAETGMIAPPVEMVKSYRPEERRDRLAVVPVKLGLDTFFKVYQRQHEGHPPAGTEDRIFWDPQKFKSAKLKAVFAEARRVAQVNVPLLITGERGTGKTTLAAWIRAHSDFRRTKNDSNWPAVPCGQYSPETMRAELFGYKQGAFTGATADRNGLLARADGDTLFLDEIGDISVPLQRLLIKAVEEHAYSPLGSTDVLKSRFRLITATNRNLNELRKTLAPDFMDRISMLRIEMPPLREIPEELPWLWEQVLREAARRAGLTVETTTLETASKTIMPLLRQEPLPGNMRDLFVAAYRLIAASGDAFDPVTHDKAVEYAMAGLTQPTTHSHDATEEVLRRFVDRSPLDSCIESLGKVDTKRLFDDVKRYIACEVRRYTNVHGLKPEEVCDVAERTLRDWAK